MCASIGGGGADGGAERVCVLELTVELQSGGKDQTTVLRLGATSLATRNRERAAGETDPGQAEPVEMQLIDPSRGKIRENNHVDKSKHAAESIARERI